MNLFSRINSSMISNIETGNNEKLRILNQRLKNEYGCTVSNEVLSIIAVKRFFDCYTLDEIIEVLTYFEQIKQ